MLLATFVVAISGVTVTPASAASVLSASFSGAVVVDGTVYARHGQTVTLNLTTDAETKCVKVEGAHTAEDSSTTAKTSWAIPLSVESGDGSRAVTVAAFKNINPQGKCTANKGESLGTLSASYVADNTSPVVTGARTPTPNGAGWNKADTTVTWSATDSGSGVGSGPTPATDTQTTETAGTTHT
ncbi:MAG: hypothetical protein ACRDOM_02950, partial [Nocardioides sp.]